MFVRRKIYLLVLTSILVSALPCAAQFEWEAGCGTTPCVTPAAYTAPPAGIVDVGGSWQWVASQDQRRRRAIGLYNQYCVRCHAVDGRGVSDMPDVPDFTDAAWQSSRTDEHLARATFEGRGALMPAFRGTLTWEESWSVAHHIRELARQSPSPPQYVWNAPPPVYTAPPACATPAAPHLFQAPLQMHGGMPRTLPPHGSSPTFQSPADESPDYAAPTPAINEWHSADQPSQRPKLEPSTTSPSETKDDPVTATDEELDAYFEEKSAGPNSETPAQRPAELPPPDSSSNGIRKYDLSAPILGNPAFPVLQSPNGIQLQSYPTTPYRPIKPPQPSYPVTSHQPIKPRPTARLNTPKQATPQRVVPAYPLSAPPGLFPPVTQPARIR